MVTRTLTMNVRYEADILDARQRGRALAAELGCIGSRLALIATVISEAARKILAQGAAGEIILTFSRNLQKRTIDISLMIRVHSPTGTIGVEESPDWKNIHGIEIASNPGETILKWTEHLGGGDEADAAARSSGLGGDPTLQSVTDQDLTGDYRQVGDRASGTHYIL
jgi:hypothetical protein